MTTHEFNLDLKWSLWSGFAEFWETYADPAMLPTARRCFENKDIAKAAGDRCIIASAPTKEARYGAVCIKRGRADVSFCHVWDGLSDLAETLNVPETDAGRLHDHMVKAGLMTTAGDYGLQIDRTVTAETFDQLLLDIDKIENEVIQQSNRAWEQVKKAWMPKPL